MPVNFHHVEKPLQDLLVIISKSICVGANIIDTKGQQVFPCAFVYPGNSICGLDGNCLTFLGWGWKANFQAAKELGKLESANQAAGIHVLATGQVSRKLANLPLLLSSFEHIDEVTMFPWSILILSYQHV